MGIFKRMKTMTKAQVNGLLDGMEDPIAMLNEYSRELEEEIVKAQKALSLQILVEKKQANLLLETEGLVAKRTRQAKLAIEQGEDTMAKMAVQEKLTNEKQLALYAQQYEAIQAQTEILIDKINELKETYNELQNKKILLASRANVAQSMKQIQQATTSFQTDNIARGVTRAEEQIMLMEAQVQAGSHFSNPLAQQDAAYQTYVNNEELERELEKLKNEKNLLVKN
jgi:phage shock protein A